MELRAALFKAEESLEEMHARVIRNQPDGEQQILTVAINPVRHIPAEPRRWLVVFKEARADRPPETDGEPLHATHRLMVKLEEEIKQLKMHL